MRLTIIAAAGGVGRGLLEQAVAAGHDVTAVVRKSARRCAPSPAAWRPQTIHQAIGFASEQKHAAAGHPVKPSIAVQHRLVKFP